MFPLYGCVPEQMAAVIPQARLIYVVRDPIARMIAGYRHGLASGRDRLPLTPGLFRGMHLATSMYGMQLHLFRRFFADEQILVVTAECLRDEREATVRRILQHIGVDPDGIPAAVLDVEHHETQAKRRPRTGLRGTTLAAAVSRRPTLTRVLTTSKPPSVVLDQPTREWIRGQLQSDLRWLMFQRPELSGWGLLDAEPPSAPHRHTSS